MLDCNEIVQRNKILLRLMKSKHHYREGWTVKKKFVSDFPDGKKKIEISNILKNWSKEIIYKIMKHYKLKKLKKFCSWKNVWRRFPPIYKILFNKFDSAKEFLKYGLQTRQLKKRFS